MFIFFSSVINERGDYALRWKVGGGQREIKVRDRRCEPNRKQLPEQLQKDSSLVQISSILGGKFAFLKNQLLVVGRPLFLGGASP